jgi:putative restriction endonuclease
MTTGEFDYDWRLRLAAFAKLKGLAELHGGVVSFNELEQGFEFERERIRFWTPRKGIWRPRQLGPEGAALTIVTAPPRAGRVPPYDDQVASDSSSLIYRYEGSNPDHWTNRAVRRAYQESRPLVYLYGIKPGLYYPIVPCFIVKDAPDDLAFHLIAEPATIIKAPVGMTLPVELERAYATVEVKRRLHQRRFRELVVAAYRTRCAMCLLRHDELLDAAHILPDRDERGRPEIPNGLCLCRIHHAAYDANILGVDEKYRIHVRDDVLEERDGPMLQYGLQELQDEPLHVPRSPDLKPRPGYLAARFEQFRAA